MQDQSDNNLLENSGWIIRYQRPALITANPQIILLIHGLSGNENVMWIFSKKFPKNYWIISPRAPFPTGKGYSWAKEIKEEPGLLDFAPQANSLIDAYKRWITEIGAPKVAFDVMGFSQGAAMSYALGAFFPNNINRVIALAGYLPKEDHFPGRYAALKGKSVFIAHGVKDEVIPITRAEEAVQNLRSAGAKVTFCQSETGHKINPSCLKGLENFFLHEN